MQTTYTRQGFLLVSNTEAHHRIPLDNVVHCSSHNSSTVLHLKDGRKIVSSCSMARYAEILESHGFVRIHQSTLLNISFLVQISHKDGSSRALLTNGDCLNISRARKAEVIRALKSMSIAL